MPDVKRILVVEDRADLREMYVENIKKYIDGSDVDSTDSRDGAIELIRRNTYHAALLDIMLIEDQNDDGGIIVLNKLVELREGTLAVMLSATSKIERAISALRSRICVDYIHKNETKTPMVYIDPLKVAISDARIKYYGKFESLTAYLAQPELGTHWEFDASQTLGGSGVETLNKVLKAAFAPLAPVLRFRNRTPAVSMDRPGQSIQGPFWSKGRGEAVWVWVGAKKASETPPANAGDIISSGTVNNAKFIVRRLNEVSRDDFVETIFD